MPERILSGFFTFDENVAFVKLSSPKKPLSPKNASLSKPEKKDIKNSVSPQIDDPFFFQ